MSNVAAKRYLRRVGERVGDLVFVGIPTHRGDNNRILGVFSCDCGGTAEYPLARVLNQGYRTHCGCKTDHGGNRRHGMRESPTYSSWAAMKYRCETETSKDFYRYGGAGIRVCDRWMSFDLFLADMGVRPEGTTLDRINPNKGYFPKNCRWATPLQQARNRKDLTVVDTPLGRMPLVDYADKIGISKGAAHLRLKRGKLEGVTRG